MRRITIAISFLFAWMTLLPAQITREQADAIVLEYLKSEVTPFDLYVNINTPNEEGVTITTLKEETIKVKYPCWVYCVTPYCAKCPTFNAVPPAQFRYLFVKEDNGSLLEVITSNDYGPDLYLSSWVALGLTGLPEMAETSVQSPYPNPVDDWLTIPCNGENSRVEIYDLKGARLFSGLLSDKEDCRLNVSFLNAGVYLESVTK